MSRPDLRGLFRTNTRDLVPVDVFTNRADEWSAVRSGFARVVADRRDTAFDAEDVQRPRRNVLAFYGVGGIGKTRLSRRIAEVLETPAADPGQWPPVDPELGQPIPVRIDLAQQNNPSFESLILAVRLALAELGRPMTAFDLAFLRYWEHRHPTEPLDDYLRRHTVLNRHAGAAGLRSQMESVLSDVAASIALPGTVGVLAGQGLRATVRALRQRRRETRALSGCRRLPDLLEAEPDQETLSYYAHLLAWDLAQLPEEKTATPIVLLDTFEDVGDRAHRDFERLIQRMVWLMPNVLFVITGRNRLQWDDARLEGQLDWAGPSAWPQLVPGCTTDPCQRRVGYLSEIDSEEYLRRRLTLEGRPIMDVPTRRVLIDHSGGLPLYLDMAAMRFLDLYERTGEAPSMDEFDHEFPALVARIFRDLSAEERTILRAVSLLDSFSVQLATAAAGLDRDAAAMRLADRPFVEIAPGAQWPYRLHDLVRTAIRETDTTSDDRWSPEDWRRAAQRAFDALGQEFTHHGDKRDTLVGCLRQGLRLARAHDLELGWLGDAAFAYVRDFVWEPIDNGDHHEVDGPAAALAETLAAIAGRQRGHRRRTADRLRTVLAAGALPPELEELPRYFLAECDRDLGDLPASLDGMRQVAAQNGPLAPDAARGLLHLERRLGHFSAAITRTEGLGAEGKQDRVTGEILWTQGSIVQACAALTRARDVALEAGQHGEAALCQAYLAFASAFQDRGRATEVVARADHMLSGTNARFAELQVLNARLLLDAGTPDAADLPARAATVVSLAQENGLSSCAAYARFALCFHAAVRASSSLMDTARTQLAESVRGDEFAYLAEITYFMTGEQAPEDLPKAHWIDGEPTTRARWNTLVTDRRRELALPTED